MSEKKSDLALLKAIIRADLKKSELTVLIYLIKLNEKTATITKNISEMALELNAERANISRALKRLKATNVVGERPTGIFVKSKSTWGKNKD